MRLLKNPKIIDNIIKNHAFRKLGRSILEKTSLLGFFFDLISWRRNMWSERKLISIYNREYVSNHGYNTEEDYRIKEAHAREIIRLLNPRKVLIAGCALGNAVLAFRKQGIEAYGFDIIPNLLDMCRSEIKPYIREGSILAIPFNREEDFDVFVCTDVFEHIQIKNIPKMVDEIYRIGVIWIATIICHDGLSPGHVTLKPLSWWERQFKGKFTLCRDIKTDIFPGIYGLDPAKKAKFTFWRRNG